MGKARQLSWMCHVNVEDHAFARLLNMLVIPFDVVRYYGVSWPSIVFVVSVAWHGHRFYRCSGNSISSVTSNEFEIVGFVVW